MEKGKICLALYSGGLDSILAIKLVEQQGIRVKALFFRTPFFESDIAEKTAMANNIDLTIYNVFDEYLEILKNPRYGYGKNLNPCIDCHGFMFRMALKLLPEFGADFVISGEVLGQRPMSQRRDAMNAVAKLSGKRDLLIRPLCQQKFVDSLPIREGWVDKSRLLDIHGRGRQRQLGLAKEFGVTDFHNPGGGCKLTDIKYSKKLKDLITYNQLTERNILFLNYGRHFRLNSETKLIVGRNKAENVNLSALVEEEIVLKTVQYQGPLGIINKKALPSENEISLAAQIVLRYNNNAGEKTQVAWGKNFLLNNFVCVEKLSSEAVNDLMIS